MPKEDHEFKRNFIATDTSVDEEHKQAELQSKIDDFKWEEDVDEYESDVPLLPEFFEIDQCSNIVMAHILETLSGAHFEGSDDQGPRFIIPIESSLHPLLDERFSDQWTLDSRLSVFKAIQEQLTEKANESDNRSVLDSCITKALPPSRKKFSSDEIILYDDALAVDDESDSITAEISIHFEAHS